MTAPFFVSGEPAAQGSMRAFVVKGRAVMTHNSKGVKPWRDAVAESALAAGWNEPLDCAVELTVTFFYVRPATHYGKKGLRPSASAYPEKAGKDLDKLVRAVGDALTGIAWRDDRRIVRCIAAREWGPRPGAAIAIKALTGENR